MGLTHTDHVVVVGAGLAGWRTCEELRRHGFEGRLTLIGDEVHAPYDRPPLSKQVTSGKWPLEHTTLATPEKLEAVNVATHWGVAARHLDVAGTAVTLEDGRVVEGSHVVIATGARARRLPWYQPSMYELRNLDDARRLTARLDELSPGDVVAIIGAGFIGAEVATGVKSRDLQPVLLEAMDRPLLNVLGETVVRVAERSSLRIMALNCAPTKSSSAAVFRHDNGDADVVFD